MPRGKIIYYRQDDVYNMVEIGSGSFGTVFSATLIGYGEVAVKCVKSKNEAFRESNRLAGLDHRNILELIGQARKGSSIPWMILEYMPMGNLIDYIRNYTGGCPAVGMIQMAHSIAEGMDYLHRHANLVHRDLACRNILVGEDWDIKIGDFGLCDSYYEDDYYCNDESGRPCPIRWMPPENLPITGKKFSRKGDIWSYGVVLFEMWSRGKVPYGNIDSEQVMQLIVQGNNPLTYQKVKARRAIKDLMHACWQYQREDRPNFRKIMNSLEENEPGLFNNSSDSDSSNSSY